MAKITKNEPPPCPPPTYTIELSKEEMVGLTRLLRQGVAFGTNETLGIKSLSNELAEAMWDDVDYKRCIGFAQLAKL